MEPDNMLSHSRPLRFFGDRRNFWGLTATLLAVVAVWYVSKGIVHLVAGPEPFDLRRRWVDQQYFFRGQNPFDIMFANVPELKGLYHVPAWRNSNADPVLGARYGGGYPPWSFISGAVFVGLPWPAVRWAFAAFNVFALAAIAAWAWHCGRHLGPEVQFCLSAASLALMSIQVTLDYGQYAIIVIGLLVGAAWLSERGRPYLAGLLLGISLLKPNISGPFCICFLTWPRYRTLLSAAAYVAVASLITSIVTKTNLIELLQQMQKSAESFATDMPNLIKVAIGLKVPVHLAVPLVAAAVLLIGFIILMAIRRSDLIWQYAVACVIARLWSYHRPYDDMMIVPLLIALGVLAARPSARAWKMWVFLAVGLSLWLPLTFRIKWPGVALQHFAWITGMITVVVQQLNEAHLSSRVALQERSRQPFGASVISDKK